MKGLPKTNHIYACGKECVFFETGSNEQKTQCKVPQLSTVYSDQNFKIAEETNDLKPLKITGSAPAKELLKL